MYELTVTLMNLVRIFSTLNLVYCYKQVFVIHSDCDVLHTFRLAIFIIGVASFLLRIFIRAIKIFYFIMIIVFSGTILTAI